MEFWADDRHYAKFFKLLFKILFLFFQQPHVNSIFIPFVIQMSDLKVKLEFQQLSILFQALVNTLCTFLSTLSD